MQKTHTGPVSHQSWMRLCYKHGATRAAKACGGTKHGTYLARDQNNVDKSLESAAVPCHFALIFHEQKLHQASRQRGERREKEPVRELAQFSQGDEGKSRGQMPPLGIVLECLDWVKITSDGQE